VVIQGHKFFEDLTVLPSNGINVTLGMDWITTHKGVISTSPRLVTLVHLDGMKVHLRANEVPGHTSCVQSSHESHLKCTSVLRV
jgi:hypothetical protein